MVIIMSKEKRDNESTIHNLRSTNEFQKHKDLHVREEIVKVGKRFNLIRTFMTRSGEIVVLSPSTDGGTNALLRNPPNIIRTCYGVDSFKKHLELAEEAGCKIEVIISSTLKLDIDTFLDIETFLSKCPSNTTGRYLVQNGIKEKLKQINDKFSQ